MYCSFSSRCFPASEAQQVMSKKTRYMKIKINFLFLNYSKLDLHEKSTKEFCQVCGKSCMFIENVGPQTLDEHLLDKKFYIIKIIYANETSTADVENNNS